LCVSVADDRMVDNHEFFVNEEVPSMPFFIGFVWFVRKNSWRHKMIFNDMSPMLGF
jgi:hypothetical protein